MTEHVPVCVVESRDQLGEGPLWSEFHEALLWVDIHQRRLQQWMPESGAHRSWTLPERASAMALKADGSLLLAVASGLADFSLETGILTPRLQIEEGLSHNRSNEGKCDPLGRFWWGTMNEHDGSKTAALYSLEESGQPKRHIEGIGISNTLAWSPDRRTMYFADSTEQSIYAYGVSLEDGKVGERRLFASTKGEDATPDGSAIDEEGFLWNCQWDGWRLVRYAPDGQIDAIIPMPVQRPTSCAFGGPERKTLYITSAIDDLDEDALQAQPLAGCLFALSVDVPGQRVPLLR